MPDAPLETIIRRLLSQTPKETDGRIAEAAYEAGVFEHIPAEDMIERVRRIRTAGTVNQVISPSKSNPQTLQANGVAPAAAGQGDATLHRARYRFVQLNEMIVPADLVDLDLPVKENLCATLTVRWIFDTPVLVGEQPTTGDVVGPTRIGDRWVLPGASLRGMIRSIVETATFGRLGRFNREARYAYRDFSEIYLSQIKVEDVRAGWMRRRKDGAMEVAPAGDDGKYWGVIPFASFGIMEGRPWPRRSRQDKEAALTERRIGRLDPKNGRRVIQTRCDRVEHGQREYTLSPNTGLSAALVSTGPQPPPRDPRFERRNEYVFELPEQENWVRLGQGAWTGFEYAHCRPGRKGLEPEGAWKEIKRDLIDKNKWAPVFWVGDLEHNDCDGFALGLTRLFKFPHTYSVDDVAARSGSHGLLPIDQNEHPGFDFADVLFGHVVEERDADWSQVKEPDKHRTLARRGRVSFGMAWAEENSFKPADRTPIRTIQGAPRPSFSPFYLAPASGGERSWSDPNARLAGRKRFLPRYPNPTDGGPAALRAEMQKPIDRYVAAANHQPGHTLTSDLAFLEPIAPGQSAFTGEIRLHNVSAAEAGAIVWALTWGGDGAKRHMIGRAKGFGAGQAKAKIVEIEGQSNMDEPFSKCTAQQATWIGDFVAHMEKALGTVAPGLNWSGTETIGDLLASADPTVGKKLAEAGKLDDLPLGEFAKVRKHTVPGRLLRLRE